MVLLIIFLITANDIKIQHMKPDYIWLSNYQDLFKENAKSLNMAHLSEIFPKFISQVGF